MSFPTVAQLRERVRVRKRVRAALGCDGSSMRALHVDDDARRELANAHNRESRARAAARLERITRPRRERRQLVLTEVIPTLNLEHLVHGEQLAALAAVLSRPELPEPADRDVGRQTENSHASAA